MVRADIPTEQAVVKLRSFRVQLRIYFAVMVLLVAGLLAIAANGLYDNHLRNSPGTQVVVATVKDTKKDCTRSGCGYDSYGSYSIYGQQEQNVKVVWKSRLPVTGQLPVLVNPSRPHFAMDYNYNPYVARAVIAGISAAVFVLWNLLIYFVIWPRAKRRLETLAARTT